MERIWAGTYLVITAPTLARLNDSTPNMRPMIMVKNPVDNDHYFPSAWPMDYAPLILERMVALATLVYSKPALRDQLARNHRKQKIDASCAVSRVFNLEEACRRS